MDRIDWRTVISEEEREIYARAGFGRPSELGDRPALVLIDVQYRTVGHDRLPLTQAMEEYPTACGEHGWAAIDVMTELLAAARARGVPVLYPHVAPKAAYDAGRLAEKVPTIMGIDAAGYEFVEPVQPARGDLLIPKRHPSAFFGTSMMSYVTDLGIDTLVVCGCTTSGCIRSTVVDAFSYNLRVAVPEDAVYDRSQLSHAVNLFDLDSKYAQVLPTAGALAYLKA